MELICTVIRPRLGSRSSGLDRGERTTAGCRGVDWIGDKGRGIKGRKPLVDFEIWTTSKLEGRKSSRFWVRQDKSDSTEFELLKRSRRMTQTYRRTTQEDRYEDDSVGLREDDDSQRLWRTTNGTDTETQRGLGDDAHRNSENDHLR